MTQPDYHDFRIVKKFSAIEDILHRCENDDNVLQNLFEKVKNSGWENLYRHALLPAKIVVDKRWDRECPSYNKPVE